MLGRSCELELNGVKGPNAIEKELRVGVEWCQGLFADGYGLRAIKGISAEIIAELANIFLRRIMTLCRIMRRKRKKTSKARVLIAFLQSAIEAFGYE